MKIQIGKALDEGFQTLLKNPIIFAPLLLAAILSFLSSLYAAKLMLKFLGPLLPEGQFSLIPLALAQETTDAPPLTSFDPSAISQLVPEIMSGVWGFMYQALPLFLVVGLIAFICSLMAIRLSYNAMQGIKDFKGAFIMAIKKCVPLLISSLLVGIMVIVGSLLLIVPGIYLAIRFSYYLYAGMIEEEGIFGSLRRSWEVTAGNWWRTLGLLIIIALVAIVLGGLTNFLPPLGMASLIVMNVINLVITAWITTILTCAYLQARAEAA
jgi:hypothetical protein